MHSMFSVGTSQPPPSQQHQQPENPQQHQRPRYAGHADALVKEKPSSHQEATGSQAFPSPRSNESPSMDRSAQDYSQPDHASAAAASYGTQQEARSSNYQTSATPTSDYGVYPTSARSASFPDHIQRSYHPASNHSASSGGMAQPPTSPSVPQTNGVSHQSHMNSDSEGPIDPSIAAQSPTYGHGPYSSYAAQAQDMAAHSYQQSGSAGIYTQPRPDWTGYGQHHGSPLTPQVFSHTPTSAAPGRHNQVYSFVPIPGAQQHKRPRRRYEEIERMYKCGWQGCEKAYGTLNHLNAHVTMQSHGTKRTPEEFKEIRKEWKARKKEEEAQRKAEEERQRQAAAQAAAQPGPADPSGADGSAASTSYASSRAVQLPPIGYQATQYPAPPSTGLQGALEGYNGNHVYQSYQPASPYGQPSQSLYSQHNGGHGSN